jgi:Ca-activated chloride channel homolog
MGRHRHRRGLARVGREPALLAAFLVALLGGSVLAVRLVGSTTPARVHPACAGPTTTISVGADTSALDWMTQLAKGYTDEHRTIDGRCIAVAVRQMTVTQAEQALQPVPFPGGGPPPDAWVPESTTALDLVRARADNAAVLPARAAPVATSPLVIAAPTDVVHALAGAFPAGQTPQLADYLLLATDPAGWGQRRIGHDEWGKVLFSLADPGQETLGVSLLMAAAGGVTGTPASAVDSVTFARREAKQGLIQFSRSIGMITPTTRNLLDRVGNAAITQDVMTGYGLVAAYEKDIWKYNVDGPPVLLQALYPLGGALAADYPFVIPNGSWVDGLHRRGAADFRGWLVSSQVQGRLGAYGLRRATGVAGPELAPPDRGLDTHPLPPTPPAKPAAPTTARTVWKLLTQRVSILALIDVSGSMIEKVPPTNQTKLDVVLAAARASLQLISDQDRIGLWEFSTDLTPGRDYKELVPLGPAAGKLPNGPDRRRASLAAYATMRPGGGTGLYDSVLAAYESASAAYQSGFVNSVVVLSDGKNDDTASIGLDGLLRELRSRYSPIRPVHIVTISYGKDTDPAVLRQIAKATDGLSFDAPDPLQIGQTFVTALGALTA